ARTRKMTEIFARMRSLAASVRASFPEFKLGASAGERLAAVAILQMFPSSTELSWLAERLDPNQERAFFGYQAAQDLLQDEGSLPSYDCQDLLNSVTAALALEKPTRTNRPAF